MALARNRYYRQHQATEPPRKGRRLRKRFSGSFMVHPCLAEVAPKALFVAGWATLLLKDPLRHGQNAECLDGR